MTSTTQTTAASTTPGSNRGSVRISKAPSTASSTGGGKEGANANAKPPVVRMASLTVPETTMEKRGSFCDRERLLGLEKKFYTVSMKFRVYFFFLYVLVVKLQDRHKKFYTEY